MDLRFASRSYRSSALIAASRSEPVRGAACFRLILAEWAASTL